jgi:hypothetical protein
VIQGFDDAAAFSFRVLESDGKPYLDAGRIQEGPAITGPNVTPSEAARGSEPDHCAINSFRGLKFFNPRPRPSAEFDWVPL